MLGGVVTSAHRSGAVDFVDSTLTEAARKLKADPRPSSKIIGEFLPVSGAEMVFGIAPIPGVMLGAMAKKFMKIVKDKNASMAAKLRMAKSMNKNEAQDVIDMLDRAEDDARRRYSAGTHGEPDPADLKASDRIRAFLQENVPGMKKKGPRFTMLGKVEKSPGQVPSGEDLVSGAAKAATGGAGRPVDKAADIIGNMMSESKIPDLKKLEDALRPLGMSDAEIDKLISSARLSIPDVWRGQKVREPYQAMLEKLKGGAAQEAVGSISEFVRKGYRGSKEEISNALKGMNKMTKDQLQEVIYHTEAAIKAFPKNKIGARAKEIVSKEYRQALSDLMNMNGKAKRMLAGAGQGVSKPAATPKKKMSITKKKASITKKKRTRQEVEAEIDATAANSKIRKPLLDRLEKLEALPQTPAVKKEIEEIRKKLADNPVSKTGQLPPKAKSPSDHGYNATWEAIRETLNFADGKVGKDEYLKRIKALNMSEDEIKALTDSLSDMKLTGEDKKIMALLKDTFEKLRGGGE